MWQQYYNQTSVLQITCRHPVLRISPRTSVVMGVVQFSAIMDQVTWRKSCSGQLFIWSTHYVNPSKPKLVTFSRLHLNMHFLNEKVCISLKLGLFGNGLVPYKWHAFTAISYALEHYRIYRSPSVVTVMAAVHFLTLGKTLSRFLVPVSIQFQFNWLPARWESGFPGNHQQIYSIECVDVCSYHVSDLLEIKLNNSKTVFPCIQFP